MSEMGECLMTNCHRNAPANEAMCSKHRNKPINTKATLKVMIIVPHYWGKSTTIKGAWDQVKKASYKNLRELKSNPYKMYVVWDTDEVKTYVDDMGTITYPTGHRYTQIDHRD